MKKNAGERLFEAIGQIPDQMVQEAAQEPDSFPAAVRAEQADEDPHLQDPAAVRETDSSRIQEAGRHQEGSRNRHGYLKYLPVAACLCMVLAGAGYVVRHFIDTGRDYGIQMSGSLDDASDGAGQITEEEVVMMDQAADTEGSADMKEDAKENTSLQAGQAQKDPYGTDGIASDAGSKESEAESKPAGDAPMLPVRDDAYEGPVFPLTATGDTQKLKVSRTLKASVQTQGQGDEIQPLLQVADIYQIKNTSKQDKTLQLVYPFVTTLNRAFTMEGNILQIKGREQAAVTYGIGESIRAYRAANASGPASVEDYRQIFTEETDYQEQALAKEADWSRSVRVYTFTDIKVQEETAAANASGVIGVTVNGAQADVITYGFDHSFQREDGSRNYCFFIPEEEKQLLLIVTGEIEGDPEPGYYTNLDCEEKIAGVTCSMSCKEMSYADALRLCSKDAARKLRQDYGQGLYDAKLPEYMDEDAAFRVLTMISEEDDFYRVLMQRYENAELTEVFERMFGETRVVYAMATVTIPAKATVRAVVQTQKRQNAGNYILLPDHYGADTYKTGYSKTDHSEMDHSETGHSETDDMPDHAEDVQDAGEVGEGETYAYYFLSQKQSRLHIRNTDLRVALDGEWKIVETDCGLEKKRDDLWKGEMIDGDGSFVIAGALGT